MARKAMSRLKWMRLVVLDLILAALLLCFVAPASAATPVEWEYLKVNDGAGVSVYGVNWSAQTFTVLTEAHSITKVFLRLARSGSPGTINLFIRETDGTNPTISVNLATATYNGDIITTNAAGDWYEFDLSTALSVEATTTYTLIVNAPSGTASAYVLWRLDDTAGAYAGGSEFTSGNGGSSWSPDTDDDYMFDIYGYELLAIKSAKVFQGYFEDDDMLFVVEYENTYVPYYPDGNPAQYFDIRLTGSGGTPELGATVCKAWRDRPGAIYLSADNAAPLTPGSSYRLYIYGVFTGTPSKYYTLTGADWIGDDPALLDDWVLATAHNIATYEGSDMTTYLSKGEVLNQVGGAIFAVGIPYLQEKRPELFQITLGETSFDLGITGTNTFDTSVDWDDMVGPDVADFLTTVGGLFGLGGKEAGQFLLLFGYLFLGVAIVAPSKDATLGTTNMTVALGLGIPLIFLGAWLRLIGIVIIAVSASFIIGFLIYSLWFART